MRCSTWLFLVLVTACAPAAAPSASLDASGKSPHDAIPVLSQDLAETRALVATLEARLAATEAGLAAAQSAQDTSAKRIDEAFYRIHDAEYYLQAYISSEIQGVEKQLAALGYIDALGDDLAALEATACALADVALVQATGGKPTSDQVETLKRWRSAAKTRIRRCVPTVGAGDASTGARRSAIATRMQQVNR